MSPFRSRHALAAQLALVSGSALVLAAPPAQGAMLLLPTSPGAERAMVSLALDRDALLIGAGPLPGSLVVFGERAALLPPMLGAGVLVFAAPPSGCEQPEGSA